MKVRTIAFNAVRRLLRERSNVFFVFIFPMLLILVIGASFGGDFRPRLGVISSDGQLAAALVAQLEANEEINTDRYEAADELTGAVQAGRINAGVIIPEGYDDALLAGGTAAVEYVAGPSQLAQQLQQVVAAAVTRQSTSVIAARLLDEEGAAPFSQALDVTSDVAASITGITVEVESSGESVFGDVGQFDVGAPSNLVLFMFLTSLAGSAALIQSRRWGVSRRMLSTPTSSREILAGEALGRFAVALVQGLIIMIGSLLAFAVDWGDPLGAAALLVVFAACGAGAGMLLGSIVDNDEQGGSIGVFAALGLAAIGGAMFPVELFPDTMQTVAHLTPHTWAIDGFSELIRRDGTIADIGLELAVLTVYAAVLLAIATFLFRRKLTT